MFARSTLGESPASGYSAEVYSRAQRCASSGDFWHDMYAAFNAECFAFSPAGWSEILAFKTPPMPPAVKPPADIITPPANKTQAEQTITDVLTEQMRNWQARNIQFFATQPTVPGDDAGHNTTLLLAAAAIAGVSLLFIFRS